jgi:pyrimidine oxygenase
MEREVEYGVFLPVGNGGFIPSETAPDAPGTYEHNRRVVQLAEELGLGFVVSMARWRGFGGSTHHSDRTIESLTSTAGWAECTSSIQLFATIHTAAFHPAVAAKMVATIDEISHGRVGVNVVAGSNPVDHGQMGIWLDVPHNELYEIASEWITVAKRLWTEPRVNFDGKYYHLVDCQSEPKPVQEPYPPLLCAATSDTGMRFTIREATASLVNGRDLEDLIHCGQRSKELARELGRSGKTVGLVMVVPAASDAEGQERVDLYNRAADVEAIKTRAWEFSESAKEFSRDEAKLREARRMYASDGSVIAITRSAAVGEPDTIADVLVDVIENGQFDCIGMYFPDYIADLETFGKEVLPRLAERGYGSATVKLAAR